MTGIDRFAEVREIEGRVAAKIVERDKALWPPRRMRLNRELRYLLILLNAAITDAASRRADAAGYVRQAHAYMLARYGADMRFSAPGWYGTGGHVTRVMST